MDLLYETDSFKVTFQIKYQTVPGESLAVLGSIPELGNWEKKSILHHLKWTDGHVWVSEKPLIT